VGLVIDSSVLISAERGTIDWKHLVTHLSAESPFISAITLSELWHGCHRGQGPKLKKRLKFIGEIEALLPVLPFAAAEARIHAKIWADLEKVGQRIGLHDLIMAATALTNDFPLATLNEGEFKRIPNLRLVSLKPYVMK